VRLLALPPLPLELLATLFGDPRLEVVAPAERTQQHVDALLPEVDLVLGDWTPQLRVGHPGKRVCFVQQPSAGVVGIDLDACSAAGVPVSNCAGANAVSVAEWCLSATLALLRRTVEADTAVRRGEWPQVSLGGRELRGLSVGIVGMGGIGRAAAELYSAVGCRVAYWSRRQHEDAPVPFVPLPELAAGSDVVVVVIALGPQTRGLVDAAFLDAMRPGALLVNGARGEVVDEAALVAALAAGRLTAASDVFAVEPLPADSPLRTVPGLLLSPHMAGSTTEAAMRIVAQAKANLERALDGRPVHDVVNGQDPLVRMRA
jgi:D-3-phosphoglycerate dehydrogenase